MATQLTNYQCPACTGPLHFDGASGKLVCDFCGSSYDTAEIEALYFVHPVLHEQNLQHEELLACHPEQWAHLLKSIAL
jgi:uncharacterized Zn finger protein (UPF0148 family)